MRLPWYKQSWRVHWDTFKFVFLPYIYLLLALTVLFALMGCSPYVGYTHLSDPNVKGDGIDLLCGGVKIRKTLELSAAVCSNVRGGEYVKIDVEYVFNRGEQ